MKIALSNAHAHFAQGATYQWVSIREQSEWPKSKAINEMVKELLKNDRELEVVIVDPEFPGDTYKEHLNRTVAEINKGEFDFAIETHFNANPNPKCEGYEVLYQEGAKESRKLAFIAFDAMKKLPLQSRSIVPRDDIGFLKYTKCPAIMLEAGFLSNPHDRMFIMAKVSAELIAKAIVRTILEAKEI